MQMDSLQVKYTYNGLEFIESNGRMHADKLELEKCKAEWLKRIGKKKGSRY